LPHAGTGGSDSGGGRPETEIKKIEKEHRNMKKTLALILALCMVFSFCAVSAYADNDFKLTMRLSHVFGPTE
jgi:hypothetical protein